jgi:hypothetical protein
MPTGYCRTCGRPDIDLRRQLCGTCYQRARRHPDFQGRVETTVVREHIQALHAAGLGDRRIAALAGVDRSVVRNISVGRRAAGKTHGGPARYCLLTTAADILAVPIPAPDPRAVEHRALRVRLNPRPRRRPTVARDPSWLQRYTEYKDLGYNDFQIARRLNIAAVSMIKQMSRYGITPDTVLVAECTAARAKAGR